MLMANMQVLPWVQDLGWVRLNLVRYAAEGDSIRTRFGYYYLRLF
jgi:hypothetical protein